MPTPSFVPLVGSGFDQLGQQQIAWQGFNAQQDAQNRAAAQAQDRAANEYFSRLAQMQQQDAEASDRANAMQAQTIQKQRADQLTYAQNQQQSAESKREFDVTSGQNAAEFQSHKDYQDKQLKRQQDTTADYATHLQPLVDQAGKELDSAQEEHDKSLAKFSTRLAKASSEPGFPPGSLVAFSNTTRQYELSPSAARLGLKLTPEQEASVQKVNDELGNINSDYLLAKQKLDHASAEWKLREGEASKWNLMPSKQGNTWLLRSSELGRTFGQMVDAAKEAPLADRGPMVPLGSYAGSQWSMPQSSMNPDSGFVPRTAPPEISMTPEMGGVLSGAASGVIGAMTGDMTPRLMMPKFIPQGQSPSAATGTMPPAPVPASSVKEVTRMTKDGRLAVFDATTKQFMRWADNTDER